MSEPTPEEIRDALAPPARSGGGFVWALCTKEELLRFADTAARFEKSRAEDEEALGDRADR